MRQQTHKLCEPTYAQPFVLRFAVAESSSLPLACSKRAMIVCEYVKYLADLADGGSAPSYA